MENVKEKIRQKYKIKKDKRGRYYTYVYEGQKRIQLNRKSEDELIIFLIDWDRDDHSYDYPTLGSLFPEWIELKEKESPSKGNAKRIRTDWKRFYENDPIIDRDLRHISVNDWYVWKIDRIKEFALDKKQKCNMNSIANGIYDYAIRKGILTVNLSKEGGRNIPASLTEVNQKYRTLQQQVFLADEIPKALRWLSAKDLCKKNDALFLGLGLNFYLGLRVGELSALKLEDFGDDKVMIHRQEVVNFSEDGMHQEGLKIVNYTKCYKSRTIVLSSGAIEWFRRILDYRDEHNLTSEFLLCSLDNVRIPSYEYERGVRNLCEGIGTTLKGVHGIRKSAISAIAAIDLNLAQEMGGHSSKKTTLDSYVFNLDSAEKSREKLDKAYSMVYSAV